MTLSQGLAFNRCEGVDRRSKAFFNLREVFTEIEVMLLAEGIGIAGCGERNRLVRRG